MSRDPQLNAHLHAPPQPQRSGKYEIYNLRQCKQVSAGFCCLTTHAYYKNSFAFYNLHVIQNTELPHKTAIKKVFVLFKIK